MQRPNPSRLDSLPGISGRVLRRLRRYYRRWFNNKNHVFVHRGPFRDSSDSTISFASFERAADLPPRVVDAILMHDDAATLNADIRELDENAVLWVAFVDDELAGILFARQGQHFKRWFVDLNPHDLVVFRMRTYPEFKGRGVAPSLIRHMMHASIAGADAVYIDCQVHNVASIRCILKVGFLLLATMRPLSRTDALGAD